MKISKKWRQMSEIYEQFVPKETAKFISEEQYESFRHQNGFENTFDWKTYFENFIEPKLGNPYDFGGKSALDMFSFESTGTPRLSLADRVDGKFNGFLVGKHWMDATIKMWKEGIDEELFTIEELTADLPKWFIQKIFPNYDS